MRGMARRIDPRVIVTACIGWSLLVWTVTGLLISAMVLFGKPGPRLIGIMAALVGLVCVAAGAMSVGAGGAAGDIGIRFAGKAYPARRRDEGIPPGGLTFFGYMLVAGLQPLAVGLLLLDCRLEGDAPPPRFGA